MAVVDLHRAADEKSRDNAALSGLDALESADDRGSRAFRLWASLWPKVAALVLALAIWQLIVWSGWKPSYTLPGPDTVLPRLGEELSKGVTWRAIGVTMRRAAVGFSVAIVAGSLIGIAVSRVRVLRTAVGSMITGLQTMPSISWFPLALILFKQSESAILFVVLIGAAPSIANGLIAGIDQIPPILLRAGRVLGATGVHRYRHVVIPAALPSFVAGLKQGWAFTWRSLMAGELLVIIANKPSIGSRLKFEQEFADSPGLISWMLIILIIGVLVDAVFFGSIERVIRERRGLGEF
ncbi:MAG TPA: ABC transporter permease [Ilumatobacteraceae bacterium]|nr:ABC transporter permease [Ilumatobacteraceae bacterium]